MRFGILLLVILPFAAGAQAPAQVGSAPLLFTLKTDSVYTDEFVYLFRKNHPQPADFTEVKIDEYISLLVNFKLKVAEARSRGMDTTQAFRNEYNTYKEELKKPYLANADELDRLSREAYERLNEEIHAAHLLITLKPNATSSDTLAAYEKIRDLRTRALERQDFGKLAKQYSEDPTAKTNNGDLGYFTALQMVYPFEQAAYATTVGQISRIVRTRFGYHIINVIDRRPAQGEVEVSHILIRKSKGDPTQSRNLIFEIYDQLKGGRKWEDVCKEYSEDTNTKNSGGRLKPFGVGALASVPEFEKMAFFLKTPGELSDPFESTIGWHIIRLEKKIPLPPYKEIEASLKRKVSRDDRLTTEKANTFARRKKELNYHLNDSIYKAILPLADSNLVKGRFNYPDQHVSSSAILFEFQDQGYAARNFLRFIADHRAASTLAPTTYFNQLLDRYVEEKMNEWDERELMAKNPDYKMLLGEYREGILLFEIMEKEVWNKASSDTVGQRKYYRAHMANYKAGDRVEAQVYGTPDKAFRDAMKNKILAGDTLPAAELKKFTSITSRRTFKAKDSQVIDKVNHVQGFQETEVNGTYYLVNVIRLIPPGTQSFEEARAAVISDYTASLENTWIAGLKKKYGPRINKEGRKAVLAELNPPH